MMILLGFLSGHRTYFLGRMQIVMACALSISVFHTSQASESTRAPQVNTPAIEKAVQGRSIVLFQSDHWKVVRDFPHGHVDVFRKNTRNSAWIPLELSLEWRLRIHPLHIGENQAGQLFITSYDLIDNLPSGRRLQVVDGADVWRIDDVVPQANEPQRLLSNLQLGGIDALVYAEYENDAIKICGGEQCYSWKQGFWSQQNKTVQWKLEKLADYEFVELVFEGDKAAALIRRKYDDRASGALTEDYAAYHLATLHEKGVAMAAVSSSGIPWNLRWYKGQPVYDMASRPSDYQKLFLFEIARMPMAGAMSFGSNNFEGRIAWAQHYYLSGMLSVLEGAVDDLFSAPVPGLQERVSQETQLIVDLCANPYPGYLVKRYSLEREPMEFALHLGRIASLLARTSGVVDLSSRQACLDILKHKLLTLERTVEKPTTLVVDSVSLPYLRYTKGMPFWADGSTVPYNYVSGYAEGLLALNADAHTADQLSAMLAVLVRQEFTDKDPKTWRYAGNVFDAGWTRHDGISINTPSWKGNRKALAHITYRTMDARAVLALERQKPGSVERALIAHFRELTRTGWLLPAMNEVFAKSEQGTVQISTDVAKRYARANAPWELQSSVWALNQLAQDARP